MQTQTHAAFHSTWRNLARSEDAYGLYYLARKQEGDVERGQALLASARETFTRLGVNG